MLLMLSDLYMDKKAQLGFLFLILLKKQAEISISLWSPAQVMFFHLVQLLQEQSELPDVAGTLLWDTASLSNDRQCLSGPGVAYC